MDTICINDISVSCLLGIYEAEQENQQSIVLDLEIETDLKKCAMLNDLAYSVDYAALVEEICFIVKNAQFRLLEVLVDCVAHYVLNSSPEGRERTQINSVKVKARKPEAMGDVATPSITIKRTKEDLWFKTSSSSGISLIYSCDDCKVYTQSGSLEVDNVFDKSTELYLMSLSSNTRVNDSLIGPAVTLNLSSTDLITTLPTCSNLLLMKNISRKEVGASFETGFAQAIKN